MRNVAETQHSASLIPHSAFNRPVFEHEPLDCVCMPSANDDVMVADGMLQQIGLQVYVERDLRAAKMVAVGRLYGLCFGDKKTV